MSEEQTNHENFVPLHNQLLKQNAEDIKELKELTFGLPQTLERIEYVVEQLGKNVDKFLDSAADRFQTKEMCVVCIETKEKEISEANQRIDKLEKKWDYLIKTVIGILLAAIGFGLKYLVIIIAALFGIHIA